jgi:hypothetical protein
MEEVLLNTILLYVLNGFLPTEFNNNNILKTEKSILSDSALHFKCNNNNLYHELYIQKYQTDNSNQYLQVVKCHNCNTQWKEIWTTSTIH